MTYRIKITETLERTIEVDADNLYDALRDVESKYVAGEIMLDWSDYTGYDMEEE